MGEPRDRPANCAVKMGVRDDRTADDAARAVMDRWVYLTSLIGDDPIAGMRETAGNAVPGLTLPIFAAMIDAGVNVFSSSGLADGRGSFGYVVYVRPKDFDKAATVLGV